MSNFKSLTHHPRIQFILHHHPSSSTHQTKHLTSRYLTTLSNINLKDDTIIRNPVGVQLLPRPIHQQIFPINSFNSPDPRAIKLSLDHLKRHNLASQLSPALPAPSISLPTLQGDTIDDHFQRLGHDRSEPYLSISNQFAQIQLPSIPTNWAHQPGWTIYHSDGSFESIEYPPLHQNALVFDVETLPSHTQYAIMATAATSTNWFSWLSPWLLSQSDQPDQLIPMPSSEQQPRLIVGHHVGFDRARIRDEHCLERSATRFMDTMSLHIATYGLSNPQRPAFVISQRSKKESKEDDLSDIQQSIADHQLKLSLGSKPSKPIQTTETSSHGTSWTDVSSMNSLDEVARLHCGIQLDKSTRNAFLSWDRPQIVAHLSQLLDYCSADVSATHAIFSKLLPTFLEQCPHPVSFAGMLHMGNPFLPVDETWERFLERAEATYAHQSSGVKTSLLKLAEATRKLMFARNPVTGRMIYEDDHWLKQLDWAPKKARWTELKSRSAATQPLTSSNSHIPTPPSPQSSIKIIACEKKPTLPAWFADLRDLNGTGQLQLAHDTPLAAILFRVAYHGHPVIFSRKHGWMFMTTDTPFEKEAEEINVDELPSYISPERRERLYLIPSPSSSSKKTKVRTLLSKKASKLFSTGILSSPYTEAATACQLPKNAKDPDTPLVRSVYEKLVSLANEAKELSSDTLSSDPWLRQLDWSPVEDESRDYSAEVKTEHNRHVEHPSEESPRSTKSSSKDLSPNNIPEEDKVWPHWYWLLTRGGVEKISLTTKSQITPLLLRLSFLGFPLYRSRQHGWTFRIPLEQLTEPYLSRSPLVFSCELDSSFVGDQADAVYFKLPHPSGDEENVGSPLGKSFDLAFENGVLQATPFKKDDLPTSGFFSETTSTDRNRSFEESDGDALTDNAREALSMNMQCSYWLNASQRIKTQMVVWRAEESQNMTDLNTPTSPMMLDRLEPEKRKQGIILPQVTVMGTVTRRATEKTWLAAANAKKNKIGTELKSMVRAPPGYAIVGADVDSEELWISSVMGDAQFGMHGATAIGWMTLEGTKSAGTDLHSKTATILGISRNEAKVFNYSRIYGAGVTHAVQLLMKADPKTSKEEANKLAKKLYGSTKGLKNYRTEMFGRRFWFGGTESFLFNKLEEIALADEPMTPALGCGITRALRKAHLPTKSVGVDGGPDFMTSRVNWAVQSSGVDYLHLLVVAMDYLLDRYGIQARYMISVHDEIRYLSAWEDRYRTALALQIANLWTRSQFAFKLEMNDLPQSCAWFSAVDVDHVLRKEVDLSCVTPSNPNPIPPGESLDIESLLKLIPDGLGKIKKPLKVSTQLSQPQPNKMKHRSENLEWLGAQASKDREEVKRMWDLSRQPEWKTLHGEEHMFDSEVWKMIRDVERNEERDEHRKSNPKNGVRKPLKGSGTDRDQISKIKKVTERNRLKKRSSQFSEEQGIEAWKTFDEIRRRASSENGSEKIQTV
ncbi:DNA polymerase family A-domain-containing protein [Melampsora americana]|nr:DNA polymerase family A-domain-containing protein [Melampsora americana]